ELPSPSLAVPLAPCACGRTRPPSSPSSTPPFLLVATGIARAAQPTGSTGNGGGKEACLGRYSAGTAKADGGVGERRKGDRAHREDSGERAGEGGAATPSGRRRCISELRLRQVSSG